MGGWMVIYKENEELQNIMPNFKSHGGGGSRERSYFTTRVQFIIHFAIIKTWGRGGNKNPICTAYFAHVRV